jgi:hypothetical protein
MVIELTLLIALVVFLILTREITNFLWVRAFMAKNLSQYAFATSVMKGEKKLQDIMLLAKSDEPTRAAQSAESAAAAMDYDYINDPRLTREVVDMMRNGVSLEDALDQASADAVPHM